jgi:phage terminase large subunit-like protein
MAKYVTDHTRGPACIPGDMPHKMALIAPTIGDAVESADRHPICLRTLNPDGRLVTKPGGTIFAFVNGSEMKLFGTNNRRDVDHLRAGGNNCLVWVEELAAWPELAGGWDQMQLGLRIGPHPHWVGSSTPKNRPQFKQIVADPHHHVTRAHTDDNPHLEGEYRERLDRLYGGTTKGRQELAGEILEESDDAHWRRQWIDDGRVTEPGQMGKIIVGVDPQGSAATGMTGIVAAGSTVGDCPCGNSERLPHVFVLEDGSIAASPNGWAIRTVEVYDRWTADRIAAEQNFGHDMVESTLRTAWPEAPITRVHASRGKVVRAEPVAALYEQGRVHHVGVLPELEDELTTYTADESWSPNRLDALVWAITELKVSGRQRRSLSGVDLTSDLRTPGLGL